MRAFRLVVVGWLAILLTAGGACGSGADETPRLEETATASVESDAVAARARFWETYRAATDARTDGEVAEAVRLYRAVLEERPEHGDTLHFLAQLLYARNDVEAALGHLRTLTATEAHSLRGWQQLSVVHGTPRPGWVAAPRAAHEAVRRAIDWNPGNSGAQALRARWAAYADMGSEARAGLEAALGHNPREVDAALVAAWLEGRSGGSGIRILAGLCEQIDCTQRPRIAVAVAAAEARGDSAVSHAALEPLLAALRPNVRTDAGNPERLREDGDPGSPLLQAPLAARLDLDGDGREDLWVGAGAIGEPAQLVSLGEAPIELPGAIRAPGWEPTTPDRIAASSWRASFLQGPRSRRVVLVGGGEQPVRLFAETAGGSWRPETVPGLPGEMYGSVLAAGDLDRDGLTDLVLGNVPRRDHGLEAIALLADDRGFRRIRLPLPAPLAAAVVVDVDGDDDPDVLAAEALHESEGAAGHLIPAAAESGIVRLLDNVDGELTPATGSVPPLRASITDLAWTRGPRGLEILIGTGESPEVPQADRLWRLRGGRLVDVSEELGPGRFGATVRILPGPGGQLRVLRGGLVPGDPRRTLRLQKN